MELRYDWFREPGMQVCAFSCLCIRHTNGLRADPHKIYLINFISEIIWKCTVKYPSTIILYYFVVCRRLMCAVKFPVVPDVWLQKLQGNLTPSCLSFW